MIDRSMKEFGSSVSLSHQFLDAGLTHAYERELRRDEEAVSGDQPAHGQHFDDGYDDHFLHWAGPCRRSRGYEVDDLL